jgi:ABC-type bacteriocin/lantibiotic exporter with double-glycine peptidase domain
MCSRTAAGAGQAFSSSPGVGLFRGKETKSAQPGIDNINTWRGNFRCLADELAHRLTTVENCDRLIWLEDGQLRAEGPTTEILPLYQAVMMENQAAAR